MGFTEIFKKGFGSKKSVIVLSTLNEMTREGINKAYIPKFLYKPPYGYPRLANIPLIRHLATTPYVEMCINTIINAVAAIPWAIVSCEGMEEQADEREIEHIKNFFMNPNTNNESFEDVFIKMPVRDYLEVNSAVLNKVFNLKKEMVEIVARDAGTFTKNPDIHGMFTFRDDILINKEIVQDAGKDHAILNPYSHISTLEARERSAYFQFGWMAGPQPVPFGKREIVWIQGMRRTDDHYGYSPVQILAKSLQMLIYQIESDLEYYNDNNVPKGIIGIEDKDSDEVESFQKQWKELQMTTDELGYKKKIMNSVPIVNAIPKFERIEFSSSEMQIIEKQKWYTKMVWASFGVTPTELGYTEDAQGQANQIVQSKVFKKKAINPLLRVLENRYSSDVISEFEYNGTKELPGGKKIEYPKYKFKFLVFDVEEEKNKYELYKIQTESGIKTINEVRADEGLEDVEWGDENPKKSQAQNAFTFNGNNPDLRPNGNLPDVDKNLENDSRNAKSIESKPFAGYRNFQDCVNKNRDKNDPEAYCATIQRQVEGKEDLEKLEVKAQTSESPLILKENEKPASPKRFSEGIVYLLEENEENIIKILEQEGREGVIKNLKSKFERKGVEDLINQIKGMISIAGIKTFTTEIIKNNYMNGHDDAEKELDRNFSPDTNAIKFIDDYTFDNIKSMSEDLANRLKAELQRGLMAGEGVDKLKSRVKAVFDISKSRAEAIARTETNRASNFGRLKAYANSGVKARKWLLITEDNRTSEISKALGRKYGSEDKAIPLDEEFRVNVNGKTISGMSPPFHVNERDRLMIVVDDPNPAETARKEAALKSQEIDLKLQKKQNAILDKKSKLLKKLDGDLNDGRG